MPRYSCQDLTLSKPLPSSRSHGRQPKEKADPPFLRLTGSRPKGRKDSAQGFNPGLIVQSGCALPVRHSSGEKGTKEEKWRQKGVDLRAFGLANYPYVPGLM